MFLVEIGYDWIAFASAIVFFSVAERSDELCLRSVRQSFLLCMDNLRIVE